MAVGMKKVELKLSGTLSAYLSDTATSIDVDNPPSEYPTYLVIEPDTTNEEIIKVTNVSGNTLTIVRGQGGTSAKEHQNGSAYEQRIVHLFQNETVDTFDVEHDKDTGKHTDVDLSNSTDFTAEHNADGTHDTTKVVTPTATQTLTNKTLTSPTINTPTIATRFTASGLYDNGNSGSSKDIDWSNGDRQKVTLTDNVTFTFSNAADGQIITLFMYQDATGGRTVTWPASLKWVNGGSEPSWGTGANAVNKVTIAYDTAKSIYLGQGGVDYS